MNTQRVLIQSASKLAHAHHNDGSWDFGDSTHWEPSYNWGRTAAMIVHHTVFDLTVARQLSYHLWRMQKFLYPDYCHHRNRELQLSLCLLDCLRWEAWVMTLPTTRYWAAFLYRHPVPGNIPTNVKHFVFFGLIFFGLISLNIGWFRLI